MKIGVFDSGVGGLTIVKYITEVIKGAEIFYVADTKNAPYGDKSPEQILQNSLNITNHLIETHTIDILILACNTATSFAIKELREIYPSLIIIGTEPGLKPAINQTKTGKIGVLATPATLLGNKYKELAQRLSLETNTFILQQPCPGLVEQIEKGHIDHEDTNSLLTNWLTPMIAANVDTIVLGCTHYPLVEKNIQNIVGKNVKLVHTGEAISKHLLRLCLEEGHCNNGELKLQIYTTGNIQRDVVSNIIEYRIPIQSINLNTSIIKTNIPSRILKRH